MGNSQQISLQLFVRQPLVPKISRISRSNRRRPICLLKGQSSSIARFGVVIHRPMRDGDCALVFVGGYVRVDQYLMITMGFLIIAASHNNLFISTNHPASTPFKPPNIPSQKLPRYCAGTSGPFGRESAEARTKYGQLVCVQSLKSSFMNQTS